MLMVRLERGVPVCVCKVLAIKSVLLCIPVGNGDQSLAEMALKVGGPRAPWDPLVLRGLLLRGRRAAAVAALRQLLARLQSRVRYGFLWDVTFHLSYSLRWAKVAKSSVSLPHALLTQSYLETIPYNMSMRSTSGCIVCDCRCQFGTGVLSTCPASSVHTEAFRESSGAACRCLLMGRITGAEMRLSTAQQLRQYLLSC